MTNSEWLAVASIFFSVLSTLLSPLIALRISQELERRRADRDRKERIFKTLMSTRGADLSLEHVQALNMIDVEFYGSDKKLIEVFRAWTAYHDHLNNRGVATEVWGPRRLELFVELLFQMAQYLGYDFDRTRIKNSAYMPQAFGFAEEDQLAIRKGLADVFRGERALPVTVALNGPLAALPTASRGEHAEAKKASGS